MDGEYYTPTLPLALWHALTATHKRAQTVSGPSQSLIHSLEVSGSQTGLLNPGTKGGSDSIPFRYPPVLLGGKGTSHVGWDKGDLPSQGGKLRRSSPTRPMCSHGGTPVAPRRRRVEGTAMFDSAMAASTPSPRGPKSRRRGGRLAGSHQATFRQSFMNRQVMHRRGGGLCTQVPHRRLL
jgi:hypothetical protein